MISGADIVAEARTWLGTPFVHQGRRKGAGVDCAGLVEMTPKALGLYEGLRVMPYGAQPDPVSMRAELMRSLITLTMAEVRPGDVLWFRVDLVGQHLGIVSDADDLRIVHAYGRPRIMKCVEDRIGKYWRDRIVGCFRYRGVA